MLYPLSIYHFDDITIEYAEEPEAHTIGLFLYPDSMADKLGIQLTQEFEGYVIHLENSR